MELKDILQLNPCIIHGTHIINMQSIIKHGLLSREDLNKKAIEFHNRTDAEIQVQNNMINKISVEIIGNTKYEINWDTEEPFANGEFQNEDERKNEIKFLLKAENYSIILNPQTVKPIKPEIFDSPYEGFVDSPVNINNKNVYCIIINEDFAKDLFSEQEKDLRCRSTKINSKIRELGIPLLKIGPFAPPSPKALTGSP